MKLVDANKCSLEGPYECGQCGGHVMVDGTFVEQVSDVITCPYCESKCIIEPEETDDPWIIANVNDSNLYWNNEIGYVDIYSADRYSQEDKELYQDRLPVEGKWLNLKELY